jgi:hypothetical protein
MPLSSFDFQQARVKQVLFKSRLRSVLYGVREAEPTLFSYADNALAQWIQTSLRPELGDQPAVHELERTVQQMLRTGQDLATRYQRGQIEEARTGLDQINAYADQIEAQLMHLESSVT